MSSFSRILCLFKNLSIALDDRVCTDGYVVGWGFIGVDLAFGGGTDVIDWRGKVLPAKVFREEVLCNIKCDTGLRQDVLALGGTTG
jgi:hypothetical protein